MPAVGYKAVVPSVAGGGGLLIGLQTYRAHHSFWTESEGLGKLSLTLLLNQGYL
ncbi:MAG TPA: hypothetical protein V6C85_20625 [Allocoleopsis sp.]